MANQDQWRFCRNCGVMHFAQGPCVVADGQHAARGFNFNLPHSIPEAPSTQRGWRFCHECHGLFHDDAAGKCKGNGGGPHTNQGSVNFVLPHSRPAGPFEQGKWFPCKNCGLMNFGPIPGHCIVEGPSSGIIGHDPDPRIEFILPHTDKDKDFIQ